MAKKALVVGMAKSGQSSTKLLARNGYTVVINDMKNEIPGLEKSLEGIEYINKLGEEPQKIIDEMDDIDLMVLSPVIPIFKPFVKDAIKKGIEVIGEIELGYRFCDRGTEFVCISGTNGKTTCTSLTGEIFKASGRHTFVLGNIGIPITEHAMETKNGDVIVAEVAALQLESIQSFHAHAAAMVNISEDHLNRFESMQSYIDAKCRVFENQDENDFAVLNYDDEVVRAMNKLTKAKVIYFSRKQELDEGMFMSGYDMIWREKDENGNKVDTKIIDVRELKIPGAHNVENALLCASLGMCCGIKAETVRNALREFKGVEHRIELVREKDGIVYINDSKGTNPDSTIKAVEAMSRPTILILGVGNYDKHSDFTPLFRCFGDTVKGVVASGINVPAIKAAAARTGFRNIKVCDGSFEDMINMAKDMAQDGFAVLLSPAAASWGMFSDFEERGRVFKDIVNKL